MKLSLLTPVALTFSVLGTTSSMRPQYKNRVARPIHGGSENDRLLEFFVFCATENEFCEGSADCCGRLQCATDHDHNFCFDPTETSAPTLTPTAAPTNQPTAAPTNQPTSSPTEAPTNSPTDAPTNSPTDAPTSSPTLDCSNPFDKPDGCPCIPFLFQCFFGSTCKLGTCSDCSSVTKKDRGCPCVFGFECESGDCDFFFCKDIVD